MATVGRGAAVAQIGPIHINGLVGWFLWIFVHLLYLVGFRSRTLALVSWAWNYFFWDRPVRRHRHAISRRLTGAISRVARISSPPGVQS